MTFLQKINQWRMGRRASRNKKKLEKFIKKYNRTKSACDEFGEKILEQKTEEWKVNKSRENAIKSKAIIAILIGCFLLSISFFMDIYFSTIDLPEVTKSIWNALLNILNIITSMVVGIGVSTIVLDFFSYVQYTRDRLKEIIIDKSFIKKLSEEEKKNIIFKAEESLYFKDGKILPNSLYADVKKKITPLLDTYYFSEFDMTISCDVDEDKGVIRKEILKSMKIISNKNDEEYEIPFSVCLRQPDCEEVEEAYEIISCIFQSKDITADFKEAQEKTKIKVRESDKDDTQISAKYLFKLKKGENRIEMRTKTVVPISDNTYSHYFTIPCMKCSTTFIMNTENYSVDGYGFALEDKRDSEDGKNNVNYHRVGGSLTISIDEWALPGEGSMFIINPDNN